MGGIIRKLKEIGFSDENIVLDSGIGFGKTTYQNLEILQRSNELKSLGIPIMIGHSRKGYINAFSNYPADARDIETIAISEIISQHVDYIRVHNVREHMRSLVVKKVYLAGNLFFLRLLTSYLISMKLESITKK